MRWRDSIFLAMAALALAGGPVRAQEAGSVAEAAPGSVETDGTDSSDAEKKEPEQKVEVGQTDLGGLDRMLPVGKTAQKVTLPSVDEEGRLTSVATISKITRADQENFLLQKVDLISLDHAHLDPATGQPEKTEMKISTGIYNYATKILTSDKPFIIRWPTMQLQGETLVYDSLAGHALVKGRSLLIFYPATPPAQAETPASTDESEPEPEPEESTSTTPKPQ